MRAARDGETQKWSGHYDLVVEAAPNTMVIANEAGDIVLVNLAAEKLFGYARAELLGRPVEMLVPERFRARHPANRAGFFEDPQLWPIGKGRDLFALRKDGREVPVEIALNPIDTPEGRFVLSAIIDITERKRAEERFRLAVEAAPNAMIMADRHGRIVLVNSQAEALFGYARDEMIGQLVEMIVPGRFREAHPGYRASFGADPKARAMGAGRDLFCVRKDGREVPVEIGLNPLLTTEGTFILSAVIDITERKRTEAERERLAQSERVALEEAREASSAKDEFLATLSHELRTPLNAILGWASMLRTGSVAYDEIPRALETIERNARHQARIVADILDVSRIIRGGFQLEIAKCDPASVVESVLNGLRPAARAKRLTLRSTLAPIAEILADAARLEQIVWNLIANAIKFTPKGGTVEVELVDMGSHLRLSVEDSGEGIVPEFLPRMFDRFTQADSSNTRLRGGLGLGLAIVRHLIELHGGTITAESAGKDRGARFIVVLPVVPPEEHDLSNHDPAHASSRSSSAITGLPLDHLLILVVDDEPDTLDLLKTSLSYFGATVVVASGVKEAIAKLPDFHPDIVLTDIAMPGDDGFALLKLMRDPASRFKTVPIVALTAYAGASERRALLDAGFQRHVAKPIEPMHLAMIVADVVRESEEQSMH
jgi:PAS domain S-box-containing protein